MNKKWIALLLAAVMLLSVGCGGDLEAATETTHLEETTETTQSIAGVEENQFVESDFEDPEETAGIAGEEDPANDSGSEDNGFDNDDLTDPAELEDILSTTYEEYIAMAPEEQVAFFERFPSMEDFVAWYNQVEEASEEENSSVEVSDGVVNIGDLIGSNP